MNDQQPTYTQVLDEKTGEIKYVPVNPPKPPESDSQKDGKDAKSNQAQQRAKEEGTELAEDTVQGVTSFFEHTFDVSDDKLTETLKRLEDNNRKLRFNKRLQSGKLDGRRLTSYRTSDRLFKKKAIKHKDYQFAIMLDTSGSMFRDGDNDYNDEKAKITIAMNSIIRTVRSLEELDIPVCVVAMNLETRLLKGLDEKFDFDEFKTRIMLSLAGTRNGEYAAGGTAERIAYDETLAYIRAHSKPKTQNVAIVMSDGAPNSSWEDVPVIMADGKRRLVPDNPEGNTTDNLRMFWERQADVIAYGLGIASDAKQIPNKKRINNVAELPQVMSKLIEGVLL